MKFKFKPQTCVLVAGLAAASYAEACYYQLTSATCFNSGDTVDNFYYYTTPSYAATPVIATSNWLSNSNNVTTVNNGSQGYSSHTSPTGPQYCSGPAKFVDPAGHTDTLGTWENGSACGGFVTPGVSCIPFTVTGQVWGNVSGSTCT